MNIGDVNGETQGSASTELSNGAGFGAGGSSSRSRALDLTRKIFTDRTVDMLNDQREKGQLCDGLIRLGETSFLVHRNILSASSEFFRAAFTRRGFERAENPREPQEVVVGDVRGDIFCLLIDYAYSRPVHLTQDNVLDVFLAADRFVMPSLAKDCCKFLEHELCVENCLGIAAFARSYFRCGLERAAMHCARRNFTGLASESEEFLELSADSLYNLLSSDELNVRHEQVVFEAICKWIQHEPDSRKSEMPRMLRAVRLGFLSSEYLMERIKTHDYVCENEEAKQIVFEALKHVCKLETKEMTRGHDSFPMSKPRMPYEIMFVIGGWSGGSATNIIETYDTRADQWLVCRSPDSELRAYHACVTVGHVIYIVGGFNGVDYFSSCRKFYPRTLHWAEAPPMNCKRCYVSGVALHGKVYAMGGFDGHVRLNSVERLDPSTNQWSHVMPMMHQRSDAKASVLNDKIYICGGFNGQDCLSSAEYFDPNTNQWSLIAPMRNRRSGVGVIAYHGCVYALGGFNGITRMNSAERYDPCTLMWASLPEMYSPRSNFAVGVIDDLLFTIGGFNGVTTISLVECYDDVTNEWFDAAGLSLYRSALCACVISDLPNLHDFVFKPKPPVCKRKKSHSSNASRSDSQGSPSASVTPEGLSTPQPPVPDDMVLNQLA